MRAVLFLIARICYLTLHKRQIEVMYCVLLPLLEAGPRLSIYNIFLSVHSITRCHISLKLFSVAPPQHKNTLQHTFLLLKIEPCEVTHSGKHSERETNNAVKNKRENAHYDKRMATECPADFISLSVDNVQHFSMTP